MLPIHAAVARCACNDNCTALHSSAGLCLSIDGQSISTPIQLYRDAKSPRLPFKQAGALSFILSLYR
nr:MAG TPA: hypothetical protein [Caudoviricetes sp.]